MSPVLIRFGDIAIPSYLGMFAIGACAFLWLSTRAAERNTIPQHRMAPFLFAIYAAGLVGARLLFVLEHHRFYGSLFQAATSSFPGGFASHGGLILATFAALLCAPLFHIPPARAADSAALGLCALGVSIRVGCFLGGCCFGRPTNLPWGVTFPAGSPAALRFGLGVAVHPTQLYEAGYLIALAAGLIFGARNNEFRFHGEKFLWLALGYSAARFLNEFLRGDSLQEFSGLAPAQWMSLTIVATAIVLMEYGKRKGRTLANSVV